MVVGEFSQEADLVVIGGGPGGYSAAFRAAELGVSTTIIDNRDALGGVCLHEGCVPSKTLLHVAEVIDSASRAEEFGIRFGTPAIDLDAVRAWRTRTVTTLSKGLEATRRKHDVQHVQGIASFDDSRTLTLREAAIPRLRFRRAIIAAGTHAVPFPGLPFDDGLVITPGDAMSIQRVPETMLVVGGDYHTVEIALIYASLGTAVTIACPEASVLHEIDDDLVRPLLKTLRARLAAVHVNVTPERVEAAGSGVGVRLGDDRVETFDLVCGQMTERGNVESLGLERTKATVDDSGFVVVDDQMRTNDPRLFAVGDITGHPLLADCAIHQGRVAAEVIAGHHSGYDARAVPHVVFTEPQLAWCGLLEKQAAAEGIPITVTKTPWGASGRAVGIGRPHGLTKVISDPDTGLVLGIGLVGPHASEMVAEAALAIEMGADVVDLAHTIHPHPTMSELLSDTARLAIPEADGS